jgi:hypothetical protein
MRPRLADSLYALALAAAGALAADEPPEREAYAYRFPLSGGEDAEYRAVTLPLEVYRSLSDPALRDIGVYNAAGQAVPRIFEAPPMPPDPVEQETVLGLVPLWGTPAEHREQLRLLMQRDAGGMRLSLESGDGAEAPPDARLAAYIVDLRGRAEPFEALRLDWGDSAAGFIGTLSVETGDDLQAWRRLARAPLADLAHGETRIEQNRVALDGAVGDYLRLTWSDLPEGWRLHSLVGIRRDDGPAETRDWLELEAAVVEENGRRLSFEIGGWPPVDRVGLLLPEDNVVLRARILFRDQDGEAWREAHEGVFYHVSRAGRAVASPPVAVPRVRARQWQVRVESGAAGGAIGLQLGWQPERLLFLAQGAGPFELVSGRARDQIEDFPQHRLLGDRALFSMLEASGPPGAARLGAREPLAGEAALSLGHAAGWRTALVWAGLIGAVLLVGWLALSLLRELKAQPAEQEPE